MRTHVVGDQVAHVQIDDFSQLAKSVELYPRLIFEDHRLTVRLVEHPCWNRDPQVVIADPDDDRFTTGTQSANGGNLVIKKRMKFVKHT